MSDEDNSAPSVTSSGSTIGFGGMTWDSTGTLSIGTSGTMGLGGASPLSIPGQPSYPGITTGTYTPLTTSGSVTGPYYGDTEQADYGFMQVEERMVLKTTNGDIVVHPDGAVDLPEDFPDAYRLMWEALASRFQRTVRNHVRSEAKKLIDTLREDLSMEDVKAYDAVTKVLDAFGNGQP